MRTYPDFPEVRGEWQPWFAWWPVTLISAQGWRWLRPVRRRWSQETVNTKRYREYDLPESSYTFTSRAFGPPEQ